MNTAAQCAEQVLQDGLLNVRGTASLLGVSESWVRRHVLELPTVRLGRLLRFDPALLRRKFQSRTITGNRLSPERTVPMDFKRYQRGSVYRSGRRGKQVWKGMWRQDVPNANGGFTRRQRKVTLGTVAEMPNRAQALERLAVLMQQKPSTKLTFAELVERWKATVVPSLKDSTAANYQYNLEHYLVPAFGKCDVGSLTRFDVETFLVEKSGAYCRNTLRGMRAALARTVAAPGPHRWNQRVELF